MADKTALAESSQALFCSIADYLGSGEGSLKLDLKTYPTYVEFKSKNSKLIEDSFKRTSTPGVTLKDMESFLIGNNDWYKSSVLIASKLINEINKIDSDYKIKMKGYQNLYYFRGDEVIMGNIQKLFAIANKAPITKKKQASFGNINKWNPADIYLASKKAHKDIVDDLRIAKPNSYNFTHLNTLTANLIDSGDLLPLSLKKTTSDVELVKVNFNRQDELKYLNGISFSSLSEWKPYKVVEFPTKGATRDIRIFLNNDGEVKLRHDPSAKRFVIEFIGGGAEARGGSIGSMKIFCELLGFVDSTFAKKLLSEYIAGEKEYFKQMKPIDEMRPAMDKVHKNLFDHKRGEISAINIINRVMPIVQKWFSRKDKKSVEEINNFIRIMFEYVTSRTENSGRFVIAK